MVFVDVPGLPKDLDVKYRPPRISLFPPSYRDRAFLRSIHRDVLRQTGLTAASGSESEKKKSGKTVTIQLPSVSIDRQKTDSGCQHECSIHTNESKKNKGKEKQSSKDQNNKKKDQKDGELNDDDDDSTGNESKPGKTKEKSSGTADKSKTQKEDVKFKIPDHLRSLLPYPFTSASADVFWGNSSFQKPFPEKPLMNKEIPNGWNIDHKLETARRADEKYMWSYLSQQEADYQTDAFQWLAQRDAERQNRLAQLTRDLGGLSLDPEIGRVPLNLRSAHTLPQTGNPLHGMCYGSSALRNQFNATSLPASVDQCGNIRLADGTLVVVNGQSANDNPQQPYCMNQGFNNGQQRQQINHPPGYNGHGSHWGHQNNGSYPHRNPQGKNQGGNFNSPFAPWNNNQQRTYGNFNDTNNPGNSNNNRPRQGNYTAQNNDPWNNSNGNNNNAAWNNSSNQNNDPWSQSNSNQNNNAWGQSNANKHNTAWGGDNNGNNSNGGVGNTPTWGDENNENNKPNNFYSSDTNDHFQANSGSQQNETDWPNETNDNDYPDHPFFAGGTTPANGQSAGPTMSGAKGKGLGAKQFPEYNDW